MATTKLPAPENNAVRIMRVVLDKLVDGLGVEVAIAAATAEIPFLSMPVVKQLFHFGVSQLAKVIDENMFVITAKFIIRIQSQGRLDEFDEAMVPIRNPGATDAELKRAKDAIDNLVRRSRP